MDNCILDNLLARIATEGSAALVVSPKGVRDVLVVSPNEIKEFGIEFHHNLIRFLDEDVYTHYEKNMDFEDGDQVVFELDSNTPDKILWFHHLFTCHVDIDDDYMPSSKGDVIDIGPMMIAGIDSLDINDEADQLSMTYLKIVSLMGYNLDAVNGWLT